MANKLWLDFETRSLIDISDTGLDKYAQDESTKVLMLAWAFDEEEPVLWEPHMGPMPERLHKGLIDENVEKWAWNYNFEKAIFFHVLGYDIPQHMWHDPSVLCAYMSLPTKLERAAKALGLDIDVQKIHLVGKASPMAMFSKKSKTLIRMLKKDPTIGPFYFKNWETHPEKWADYGEYCLQDVRAERAVYHRAVAFNSPITYGEILAWEMDQRMNRRGVWIDQPFVNNAMNLALDEVKEIIDQIKVITGLENPNSQKQLLEWFQQRGFKGTSIDKEHVEAALAGEMGKLEPLAKEVFVLKKKLGGSSYKKFQSILDRMAADGRLRDQFVYHGAHTGRWSGRGVQLQNLTKPDKAVKKLTNDLVKAIREGVFTLPQGITLMKVISGTIRASFAATPGKKFLVGDLAQIESRVLAALAGCQTMIDAYASGLDLYKDFMAWLLDKPITEIDDDERSRGKVVILGCGFGMGVDKFIEYAAGFGVVLTEKEAQEAVWGFRDKYSEIKSYWDELDKAVKKAAKALTCVFVRGVVVDGRDPNMLKIKLPSGRYIHYLNPKVTLEERFGRMQEGVSYEAWDGRGKQIKRLYGGLICENIVQAVARDLLLNGMLEAEKVGIQLVMTIHDEIVGEVNDDPAITEERLLKAMTSTPAWAEGFGFILAAEGWQGYFYKK